MLQKNKINQMRGLITSTLKYLSPEIKFSDVSVELILATGIHEGRNFDFIKQIQGPAISPFQIEPNTHDDAWENFLRYKPKIAIKLLKLAGENMIFEYIEEDNHNQFIKDFIDSKRYKDLNVTMLGNLYYSIAICRICYYRKPFSIPETFEIEEIAKIWKQYYNTFLGKGHVDQFIRDYQNFVD